MTSDVQEEVLVSAAMNDRARWWPLNGKPAKDKWACAVDEILGRILALPPDKFD